MRVLSDAEKLDEIVSQLNQARCVEFIVDCKILPNIQVPVRTKHKFETLMKKLAVYADKVIFLLPDINSGNDKPSQDVISRIDNIVDTQISSAKFNEIFCFLPEKIVPKLESVSDFFDDGGASGNMLVGKPAFDFETSYHNNNGYYIDLTDLQLAHHLFEHSSSSKRQTSVLNFWLPCINNIPLDVFLKIRKDESDAFIRFQRAVKKILKETNSLDTTLKIKDLFEEVDYETRAFANRMERVKRSRALRKYEILLGFCVMGVGLAMNCNVLKILMPILGSYSLKGVVNNLLRDREKIDDLRSTDFFIPWFLNEANMRKG